MYYDEVCWLYDDSCFRLNRGIFCIICAELLTYIEMNSGEILGVHKASMQPFEGDSLNIHIKRKSKTMYSCLQD